jgi:hypothetical protein
MSLFSPIEQILFNNYPFYISYIQEFGMLGAISRLNCFYQWGWKK